MEGQDQLGRSNGVLRQQATIADFGADALAAEDLDRLLTRACELAAEGLSVKRTKILERQPSENRLLVRAGVGWDPGVVGRATIGADSQSPAGYALETGWPVISEDLSKETRFRVPEILVQHGIRSAVNVIIRGADVPFGVLEVDDTAPRKFTQHDINFLQSFANLIAAAVERLRAHSALQTLADENAKAAQQNELLLRELHHRVNNNLAQIGALLRLQKKRAASPDARQAIETIETRLNAMRVLYSTLDAGRAEANVNLGGYLPELVRNLRLMSGAENVDFDVHVDDVSARIDVAVPLGLIVGEFVTNSLKHAFPGGRGTITLRLHCPGPGQAQLMLGDDGVGLPETDAGRGLGLTIISGLLEQLGAETEWRRTGGTGLTCRFNL